MYGEYNPSLNQKVTLSSLHVMLLLYIFWLLFLNGVSSISNLFGFPVTEGDLFRRVLILLMALVYFIRVQFTEYAFLKRKFGWGEGLTIALWLFIVYSTFSFTGGINNGSVGTTEYAGIALYVLGSSTNTISECLRCMWKKKPENKGLLYTGGLFKLSRHINYFGDVVLFLGFAMVTRSVWAYIIPAAMFVLFIFVNIPMLDKYLFNKYGDEYRDYAFRTKKFIPFVY
jgi:protein-S-isoprenylcysteine O-methyltransferase Ste14